MTRIFPFLIAPLVAPLIASILFACGAPDPLLEDARLLGTWRSDKRATLAEIDAIGGFTPQLRRSLEATLGRRVLTYTESRVTSLLKRVGVEGSGDFTASGPYRIVAARDNELVLETYDHVLGTAERQSVFVEGDRLWIWLAGGKWREFYRRVPAVGANAPQSAR